MSRTSRALAGTLTLALLLTVAVYLAASSSLRAQEAGRVSFFITSAGMGDGANLKGLNGADAHCRALATRPGTWRAYLSTQPQGQLPAIHARNRIGVGPWYNAKGVMIAKSVDDLHSDKNNLTKETALTEKGTPVNGRGDTPNMHDILTGSGPDGRAVEGKGDTTCGNWTSNAGTGSALVGHHDRQGGGDNPTSWNSAHASKGCSQANLQATGGNGLFYCFATD
jgi:hypothetical protein